jgi:hypothetical protein
VRSMVPGARCSTLMNVHQGRALFLAMMLALGLTSTIKSAFIIMHSGLLLCAARVYISVGLQGPSVINHSHVYHIQQITSAEQRARAYGH